MKHFEGRAYSIVDAPMTACLAVLEAVDRYPGWLGEFVEQVVVAERDHAGGPVRAHVVVRVPQSPFSKRFEFDLSIDAQGPHAVHLTRLPARPSDRERLRLSWLLRELNGTGVELRFAASAPFIPSLLPLPGVGDLIARTLLEAAVQELDAHGAPPAGAPCSQ